MKKKKKFRNLTEDEVTTIMTVAKTMSQNFAFGYYSVRDIEQDAFLVVLEAIRNGLYDETKPLRPFAYKHIRNRLYNKKRDELHRPVPDCFECESLEGGACPTHQILDKLNRDKRSLMYPFPLIDSIVSYDTDTPEYRELCQFILDRIPVKLKDDYVELVGGGTIDRKKSRRIRKRVRNILKRYEGENADQNKA